MRNGRCYFAEVEPYGRAEVDALNVWTNSLRSRIENDVIALDESGTAFRDLQGELDECCNRVSK